MIFPFITAGFWSSVSGEADVIPASAKLNVAGTTKNLVVPVSSVLPALSLKSHANATVFPDAGRV